MKTIAEISAYLYAEWNRAYCPTHCSTCQQRDVCHMQFNLIYNMLKAGEYH